MIRVKEVRINYEKMPILGVMGKPQFSWIIESDGKNVTQQFYQLQIAEDYSFHTILYDSGMLENPDSAHVTADRFLIENAKRYYIRVRVQCEKKESGQAPESELSEYSKPVWMLSGLEDGKDFLGKFVSAETKEESECSKGTYVRNSFTVKGKVKEAIAYTTALGLYEFYLNGEKVGKDILTPGWTSYQKHLLYQTYDVTDLILQGKNGIGASIGAGWYKGLIGFDGFRNLYGKQTAFACHMIIRYADGDEQLVLTDNNWMGCDSPITFSEIYDGEIYDGSKEIENWSQADFIENHAWKKTEIIEIEKNILEAQTGSRVQEIEEVKPKRIFKTPNGDTVVDFGQNMSAWLHVTAKGQPGDTIEIQCFEVLDKDGNVYLENLRTAKEEMKYVFGKKEKITYHPHFTFMGFQYIKIKSYPGIPKLNDFTAYAVHSNMGQTGYFECSNPDLNQLFHNILWGLKSNFVDIPTDCPQRNERLGWTGDAQIFCRTATFLMNTYTFYKKWLEDVAFDQTAEGGVPHVVPDILTNSDGKDWLIRKGTHSAAAWADVAVINPWVLYSNYGDLEILKKQYDSMKQWIDFMKNHAKDYIWNYKLQFGDWVALDAEEGSYFGATPNDLTCTAYFAYSTGLFVKVLKVLGKKIQAEEYEKLYQHIRNKFQETFFDQEGNMTAQTQTAHIVALYFQLTPEKYISHTIHNLKKLLQKENGHLVTGFVGTPYFCHALSQNGALQEAYELLLKEDFPSWLYQVKQGATTIWEHWDGIKPDGSMWSPAMNSFNHYAYGAIGEWMVRVMAGLEIDENEPGYKHFIIYPRIGGKITYTELSYDSIYGKIQIRWDKLEKEQRVVLKVTVPVNTEATIQLDASEVESGSGLLFEKFGETWRVDVGSGDYQISYRY